MRELSLWCSRAILRGYQGNFGHCHSCQPEKSGTKRSKKLVVHYGDKTSVCSNSNKMSEEIEKFCFKNRVKIGMVGNMYCCAPTVPHISKYLNQFWSHWVWICEILLFSVVADMFDKWQVYICNAKSSQPCISITGVLFLESISLINQWRN